jgi:hypothetical protein
MYADLRVKIFFEPKTGCIFERPISTSIFFHSLFRYRKTGYEKSIDKRRMYINLVDSTARRLLFEFLGAANLYSVCPITKTNKGNIMKLALAALLLAGSTAFGAIIETTEVNCYDLRASIQRNGWQILTQNGKPALPHYNVYHADFNQCGSDQAAVTGWVKTADFKKCPAGYRCVSKSSAYKYQ